MGAIGSGAVVIPKIILGSAGSERKEQAADQNYAAKEHFVVLRTRFLLHRASASERHVCCEAELGGGRCAASRSAPFTECGKNLEGTEAGGVIEDHGRRHQFVDACRA